MSHQENNLFWVSCNACAKAIFSQDDVTKEPVKMFVSSCGCLYCSRCVQTCTSSGCSVCGTKSKVKVVPVGKNLPQSIMEMFNKSETSLTKMNKRMEFQTHHFQRACIVLRKKRKILMEKLQNVKCSQSKTLSRKEALKKLEAKLKHRKSSVSRLIQTKTTAEAKKIQQQRMLNLSMNSNATMFAGAITSAGGIMSPPTPFHPDHGRKPSPSVKTGFSSFMKKWF